MSIKEALAKAEEDGLDLIVVAENADPPVCKIMDYGHYKYEKEKQLKQAKKGSKATVIKELKMSPKISEHDYQVRHRAAIKFLEKGNKVKITINFRGREMAHMDLGKILLDRFLNDLKEHAVAEGDASYAGRSINLILTHK
ncbi:MAG: translation initiation factor IF-3 [Candidatus Margulisbacteria bacterium GWF2_38_17]|nr:MAG: translation initiation factor IF-3 [Candidatus Margulisbacteria bacterium GWD2_39_127]OGI05480.1 MAG: translation initiation factor IF-3 [Candidatus Margulisbacteria bacterium GWF2_38_17]OGI08322.1 MAG: translation initiation factor IF-3 [Candidatus Margulisbacteria bacterium GWE2_39_32]